MKKDFSQFPNKCSVQQALGFNSVRASYKRYIYDEPAKQTYEEHLNDIFFRNKQLRELQERIDCIDKQTVYSVYKLLKSLPGDWFKEYMYRNKYLAASRFLEDGFDFKDANIKHWNEWGISDDDCEIIWMELTHAKIVDSSGTMKGNTELLEVLAFNNVKFLNGNGGDLMQGDKKVEYKEQQARMVGQKNNFDIRALEDSIRKALPTDLGGIYSCDPAAAAERLSAFVQHASIDQLVRTFMAWDPELSKPQAQLLTKAMCERIDNMPRTFEWAKYVIKKQRANRKKGIKADQWAEKVMVTYNVPEYEIYGRPMMDAMLALQTWRYQQESGFDYLKFQANGTQLVFRMKEIGESETGFLDIYRQFEGKIRCIAGPKQGTRSEGCQIEIMVP